LTSNPMAFFYRCNECEKEQTQELLMASQF